LPRFVSRLPTTVAKESTSSRQLSVYNQNSSYLREAYSTPTSAGQPNYGASTESLQGLLLGDDYFHCKHNCGERLKVGTIFQHESLCKNRIKKQPSHKNSQTPVPAVSNSRMIGWREKSACWQQSIKINRKIESVQKKKGDNRDEINKLMA
jgi:hypothetical protein